ncbi:MULTISPECIES: keywimysin-related RiPP [Saccharopolyspora]|uniref:Keywimysin-related RiPP n=1 Tax=Saccharopolyspora cebuensis TaxID=418759 RepID=A0ABV4CGD0_9PSEU
MRKSYERPTVRKAGTFSEDTGYFLGAHRDGFGARRTHN